MLINLTNHEVFEQQSGIRIQPSGYEIRTRYKSEVVDVIDNVPVYTTTVTAVTLLPPKKSGVVYIVSALCLNHIHRDDVVAPGRPYRDSNGKPIGCSGFRRNV